MRLTNGQVKAIHVAARKALTVAGYSGDEMESMRRMIQFNAGGFYSCRDKTVTREGFIAVMAAYEQILEGHGQQLARTAGYWRAENERANPTDQLVHACLAEARRLGWSERDLDDFLASKHMSSGACVELATAGGYWLGRLLSGLKAMRRRREGAHGRA